MTQPGANDTLPARDALTGLSGSEQARARMAGWLTGSGHGSGEGDRAAPVHAMLISLWRFDTVNLAFGERAGNCALVEVATRLLHFAHEEFEQEWFAARLGGGHFLLAMNAPCSRERWEWLAEALAGRIARPIADIDQPGKLRLSPRVALVRVLPGEDAGQVFERLAQMQGRLDAKRGKRILWAERDAARGRRGAAQIEADLLRAIDRAEIEVLYQPQFRSADNRLAGAEALARWQHPTLGLIGAAALFAIAERADHVAPLSRHIAARAFADAADWPDDIRLSLNVTADDLAMGTFAEDLATAMQDAGFAPGRLTVEIVEQSLLGDIDQAADALGRLVSSGVRVALDDFGAGFCNFRYLKVLPLHYLKLDRSMVEGIGAEPRDLAVLRAIVALARALGLDVLAEGIETEDQRRLVAAEGCAYYQGFLGARPLSAEAFGRLAAGLP